MILVTTELEEIAVSWHGMKGEKTMNCLHCFNAVVLSTVILSCGSAVLLAADEPPPPPARAEAAALDPKVMLARIVQLEATVVQLQKALSCMVATDEYMGTGKSYPVLPAP
jgi:hypothetical protein